MSFTTGSSPDCSDSHLSLTPQFCVPACTPCVSDTEAELYCLVCQNYLCKQCYLYHDINDYLNLHRVVFICEIANLDELIHLMSDPDVVLNLTIFNSDWIYKNMLKKQITENKQALERMLAMSDFLRKQLHVLENHRCESMRLICSSHRQFETYLRSQKDQIVTSLQNEYDGVKMSILTKAQTVDQTVRDLVVKLNKMQLMTENNGETASGIDMEMAARHGLLLNGDCMDNNVFFNDFASYLPDDFHSNGTDSSDATDRRKEFYICDFKGHAIVVMDDDGNFLRKFGGTETTMFPNGIDISSTGDVIVGDSHGNYFHVAVYSKQGNFLAQYRCPVVKVSRCCGLKMTSEGRLVTVDKNYHHVIVFESLFGPPEAFS
nr:PREDICTED: uncharacterized protein LOC103312546 [Tribolium castaneum]|eukprot:XP_008191670.1 PREDICTED: uncharacterized protein LOC103312546 [Tribolium castaneum]